MLAALRNSVRHKLARSAPSDETEVRRAFAPDTFTPGAALHYEVTTEKVCALAALENVRRGSWFVKIKGEDLAATATIYTCDRGIAFANEITPEYMTFFPWHRVLHIEVRSMPFQTDDLPFGDLV